MRHLVIVLAFLAAPQLAAADIVLTIGGTYYGPNQNPNVGLTDSSDRFDGVDEYINDLPSLFDLDRLKGGTFTATMRVPTSVIAGPNSSSMLAFYQFDAGTIAASFTLFDSTGAVVHRGATGPGTTGRGIVRDNYFSFLDGVQLVTDSFDSDTTVTGLITPPLLGGDTYLYGGAGVDFLSNDLSALSGLGIPTDLATYLRLGGIFVASAGIDTYSPDQSQYTEVLSGVEYLITKVELTTVPEPSSLILLATAAGPCAAGLLIKRLRRS